MGEQFSRELSAPLGAGPAGGKKAVQCKWNAWPSPSCRASAGHPFAWLSMTAEDSPEDGSIDTPAAAREGGPEAIADDGPGSCQSARGQLPVAAVIGTGFLGARIVAELLLLGSRVSVYERNLADRGSQEGQAAINSLVTEVVQMCNRQGLLELAGMTRPPESGGPWAPYEGEEPREARWCASIAEAVRGADIVIEAVPDTTGIKTGVLSEALRAAPPGVLLATSTLSLPLVRLQKAVADAALPAGRGGAKNLPCVVGLRFLAPVVFVPFVEVTLTAAQKNGEEEEKLLSVLGRWGKNAFNCDVQGAVEGRGGNDFFEGIQRSAQRLRLESGVAARRQAGEARLRRAHHEGPQAVAALSASDLFDFEGETCCVCLEAKPTAKSLLCGHCVLCSQCAALIETGTRRCPICRARFMQAISDSGANHRLSF
mmetsp:Transcript_81752/g.243803  ORF Transcript_81752/g.243803 Transcript_81752/m.243803 type:complete len:428 (+) Transcript_81752:47-1330(+)